MLEQETPQTLHKAKLLGGWWIPWGPMWVLNFLKFFCFGKSNPSTAVTWWLKVPLQRSVVSDAVLPCMWVTHFGKQDRIDH